MSPASLGTGIIEDVRAKCARDRGPALMGVTITLISKTQLSNASTASSFPRSVPIPILVI